MKRIFFFIMILVCLSYVTALEAEIIDGANVINDGEMIELITQSSGKGKVIVKTTAEADLVAESKKLQSTRECTAYIVYEKDKKVSVAFANCDKISSNDLGFLNGFQVGVNYDERLQELVRRIISSSGWKLAEPKVNSLTIELEKNDAGREFKGLYGRYDNSVDVIIYYPTKYDGENIRYTSDERNGKVVIEDSGCTIEYKLREQDVQEINVGGQLTKVKPVQGKLYLWDGTERGKPESGILLSYSRPKGSLSIDVTDTLQVTMTCKGYTDTKTKDILVRYDPIVVLIHGLWANPQKYDFLGKFIERYSNRFFVFDYFATNVKNTVEQNARLLETYLNDRIEQIEKEELLKVKPVLVAHSAGGLLARELAGDPIAAGKIGKVITLGTPYEGIPALNYLYDINPGEPGYEEVIKDYESFGKSVSSFFGRLRLPGMEGFGELGETLWQLKPQSEFLQKRKNMEVFVDRYTIIAGTKPIMFSVLRELGIGAGGISSALGAVITIPDIVEFAFKIERPTKKAQRMFETFLNVIGERKSDGYVPIDSAQWRNGRGVNPHIIRRPVPANHPNLLRDEAIQTIIIREIEEVPYTVAYAGSPVTIYAYDGEGNTVGFKDGELLENIPDAEIFIDEEGETQAIMVDDRDCTFVIEAFGNGTFSFSVNQRREEEEVAIYFDYVEVTDRTKASFELKEASEKHILKVDYDGDGIIDEEMEADYVQSNDILTEEKDYARRGEIKTDYVKPKSNLWIWVLGAGGAMLLLLMWIRNRRYAAQSI